MASEATNATIAQMAAQRVAADTAGSIESATCRLQARHVRCA